MTLDFVQENFHIGQASPDLSPQFIFYKRGFRLSSSGSGPDYRDIILSGNTALTLVNAKEDGLNYLKLFGGTELLPETYLDTVTLSGGCEQRNLPVGFTQVEYLESSGTQYIDTGITDVTDSEFMLDAKLSVVTSGSFPTMLGATNATNSIYKVPFGETNGSLFYTQVGAGNANYTYASEADTARHTFKLTTGAINGGILYVDNATFSFSYDIQPETTLSLYLFARNNNGSASNFISMACYGLSVKKSGVLVQNLIPCRRNSDSVLGMYDTVTNNFLTNQGTGDFIAGADVTVPSPDTPMDIVCNNGVVKLSPNVLQGEWSLNYSRTSAAGILYNLPGAVASDIFPVQSNTTYVACYNGVANNARWYEYNANKSYITDSFVAHSATLTTSSNTKYIAISFTDIQLSSVVTQEKYKLCSVNKGNVALPFVPYGQIYTDGETETVVSGKNIFDGQWKVGIYSPSNGTYSETANRICNVNMMMVKPSTKYTVSFPSYTIGSNIRWVFYDSGKNFVSAITNGNTTITTPATASYANIYIATNIILADAPLCQIEEAQTATDYEPYAKYGTASAEMLLKVGDYKDTQEVLSGSVTRNIGIKVLDGTEEWETTAQSTVYRWLSPVSFALPNIGICSHYVGVESSITISNMPDMSAKTGSQTASYVYIKDSSFSDNLTGFKQFLAEQYANGTPVIIVYPTSSATTESVSGQLLQKSPVTQTAGAISGLTITTTESAHTTPTPTQPLEINCNNGVVKVATNLVNTADSTKGQYITNFGTITSSANWATSDYIPVTAGGKISVSGLTYVSAAAGFNWYDSTKTKLSTIPYETGTHTYTVPNNASYFMITYRWVDDENTVKVYVGDTYGAIYTDGTVETVQVTGKNLFDYEYFYDNYQNYGTSAVGRCLIQLKPNTAYTISTNKNSSLGNSVMFVVSGSAIDWTPSTTGNGILAESPRTVTTDSNGYLCFGIYVEGENVIPESDFINGTVWAQIEQGSTATTYEPYYYGGNALAEDLLAVGTYQDVQSVIDGNVTRNVGIKVLDGTESWTIHSSGAMDITVSHLRQATNSGLCTHFESVLPSVAALYMTVGQFKLAASTDEILFKTSYNNTTDWTNYLKDKYQAGQPIIVIYPLATATTETVTPQSLTLQEGTNIVEITEASIDNLGLEVSYKAGVAVTITEVQNAQLDNNVEVTING